MDAKISKNKANKMAGSKKKTKKSYFFLGPLGMATGNGSQESENSTSPYSVMSYCLNALLSLIMGLFEPI